MTNKEAIKKDIGLTFNFIRQLIDNPKLAEQLPDKCEIEFLEKDFSSLTESDLANKLLIKVNHSFEILNRKKNESFNKFKKNERYKKHTTLKKQTMVL
ncbi:MAG: hypothetical protein HY738_13650 [Bacteroidia bacterium]|nr:hypothetical protein [Bacteroidia bacterium]